MRRNSIKDRSRRGVTLIELLVVVALVAILLALAVPNFSEMVISNRLTSAADEFAAALADARSEATRRGAPVSLVTLSSTAKDWSVGWTLCVDSNAVAPAGTCSSAANSILRKGNALSAPLAMHSNAAFSKAVTFDSYGRLANPSGNNNAAPSYPGVFALCYDAVRESGGNARSRAIVINAAGRVHMALDANKNGIPEIPVNASGSTAATDADLTSCTP